VSNSVSSILFGVAAVLMLGCSSSTDEAETAVAEFRTFAKQTVQRCSDDWANINGVFRDPAVERRFGPGTEIRYDLEVSPKYELDCRKSDSVLSPFVGEITIRVRPVFTMSGEHPKAMDWDTVVIECRYENGEWATKEDLRHYAKSIE